MMMIMMRLTMIELSQTELKFLTLISLALKNMKKKNMWMMKKRWKKMKMMMSPRSWFEQVVEDAHVTLIAVHDTQNTKGLMQSSFVSSDFTSKLLNLENVSLADNEIISLMDTSVHHEEPSKFELTKILMEKMEENKSHLRADYKKDLYDALVKSYNTDKFLFDTYGEVFTLKRGQDDEDKVQDP
uniref:Uncharacterized protein n=1 Tax=Tanacetum cinerariifolium TaxID=118510 RepID=A0A6L2LLM7_TANCI|nr:hypothetical protein [Tanacetum cinerariifolium]